MKRILSIALTLCMAVSLCTFTVIAASDRATAAAAELHELGLFRGIGNNPDGSINYDLDRIPTREEAITMLVRLLGKEDEATSETQESPFTDVSAWAQPYVSYAYANGLTNGIGSNGSGGQLFGGALPVSATQYITFVLRSLGYESGRDFQWDKAWELSDKLGFTSGEYSMASNDSFLRADIALISCSALASPINGSDKSLKETITMTQSETPEQADNEKESLVIGTQYKTSKGYGVTIEQANVKTVKGVRTLEFKYTLRNLTTDQYLPEDTFMFGFTDGTSTHQGGIYLDGMYPGDKITKTYNLILNDKQLSYIVFNDPVTVEELSEFDRINENLAQVAGNLSKSYLNRRLVWYFEN